MGKLVRTSPTCIPIAKGNAKVEQEKVSSPSCGLEALHSCFWRRGIRSPVPQPLTTHFIAPRRTQH